MSEAREAVTQHLEQLTVLLEAIENAWRPLNIVDVDEGGDMAAHLATLAGLCVGLTGSELTQHTIDLMREGAALGQELDAAGQQQQAPAQESGSFIQRADDDDDDILIEIPDSFT